MSYLGFMIDAREENRYNGKLLLSCAAAKK